MDHLSNLLVVTQWLGLRVPSLAPSGVGLDALGEDHPEEEGPDAHEDEGQDGVDLGLQAVQGGVAALDQLKKSLHFWLAVDS